MSTENDKNSLFRREALQHKREGWLGSSRLYIPSSLTLSLFTALITFLLVVIIITFGTYSERVNTSGTVVYDPPAVRLIAQNDGIITHSSASEGELIKRDETIFTVSGDTRTRLGSTHVEMVELLKKQRDALSKRMDIASRESEETKHYLAAKIQNKEQEIESLQKLIAQTEARSAWFEKKSTQYANFRGKGIVLDSDMIERTKDYYLAEESLSSAKVKTVTLSGELLDLKKQASSIDRDLAEKQESSTIEMSSINQKILDAEKSKEYFIVTPFDGIITNVTAHVGESVTKGQPLAVLIPHAAAVKVELLSPSDSLGEVSSGQRVKMRVAAYPYQWYGKIPGVIETISEAPMNMTSSVEAKNDNSGKGLFRIIVRPELPEKQTTFSLLLGMEVETEIYVKTRKVYEWLFVPVKKAYERATDSME